MLGKGYYKGVEALQFTNRLQQLNNTRPNAFPIFFTMLFLAYSRSENSQHEKMLYLGGINVYLFILTFQLAFNTTNHAILTQWGQRLTYIPSIHSYILVLTQQAKSLLISVVFAALLAIGYADFAQVYVAWAWMIAGSVGMYSLGVLTSLWIDTFTVVR